MAYAEAIAHGLPVIGTNAGAIPETVPAGAGVLVAPDDVGRACARAARHNRKSRATAPPGGGCACRRPGMLPTWQDSAKLFSRALEAVA